VGLLKNILPTSRIAPEAVLEAPRAPNALSILTATFLKQLASFKQIMSGLKAKYISTSSPQVGSQSMSSSVSQSGGSTSKSASTPVSKSTNSLSVSQFQSKPTSTPVKSGGGGGGGASKPSTPIPAPSTPSAPVTQTPSVTPSAPSISVETTTPTPSPIVVETPLPTPAPAPVVTTPSTPSATSRFWTIRSVSSMKETKDKICNQDSATFIDSWINKATEFPINYIAVETPYDNPSCGSSVAYTKAWVDAIHARGLNVWHRHAPLAFEGIYSVPKNKSLDYLNLISNYIKANPAFFKAGDIFTPVPEPQNGGIAGVTYCPENICIFADKAAFNKWLRDAITTSEAAFQSIGLGGKIKIGYYGFDGFVAWGDNNPDWEGILEDVTVQAMGNITIDHYPEIVGDTMENDLNELQAKYPNTPIIVGEWGTITGGDLVKQVNQSMQAALRRNVAGFGYWHFGLGGNEALVNDDMSARANFEAVKTFFNK
jgi:hypothetical protein